MNVWTILFCLLMPVAVGQTPTPYSYISPDPLYGSNDGSFIWPAGSDIYIFNEGSNMNVTWNTDFPEVHLWLIVNTSWDSPIGIASRS